MNKVLIFAEKTYKEYILNTSIDFGEFSLELVDNQTICKDKEISQTLLVGQAYKINEVKLMVFNNEPHQFIKNNEEIVLDECYGDINTKYGQFIITNTFIINNNKRPIYVNGVEHREEKIEIKIGSNILIGEILLVNEGSLISIWGNQSKYECNLIRYNSNKNIFDSFPEYKKSPRLIKRVTKDKITLQKPPMKNSMKGKSLVKVIVPSLSMALITVFMAIFVKQGAMMLVSIAGTMISLVFSVTTFFSERKENAEFNERLEKNYQKYLLETRRRIYELKEKEIEAFAYNYPSIDKIESMINEYSPRIYERDSNDDDFLTFSIGNSTQKSTYELNYDYDVLSQEKNELADEAKELYEEFKTIDKIPIIINLKEAHLGLVGEKKEIHEQLKQIISQATFFHSYHDLEIIVLYNEEYRKDFDFVRWFPHVKIHAVNLTGNIYNGRICEQVLGSLYQILKGRKLKRNEGKQAASYLPHYLIIVDDYHLVTNHSIMEYLQEPTTALGFSLIYTAQKRGNLPENIKTVIMLDDMDNATLLLNNGVEINQKISCYRTTGVDLDTMSRNLSVLNHIHGVSSHIPESITFFDLYKISRPEELNVLGNWTEKESFKSLAVPLGVRAVDDVVELNLHEKAHGPHGLIAGTTGSGKSEIIQSYILSLAVNFHPHEVGFLLIDYKGGGMASLFKDLPHLLGTITNLDGSESMRALASIKSEMKRRQRVFNDSGVNNISNYTKLFKKGDVKEPMPHLFIISDEFAELKKEQPEFMSELVSASRIGRSLGIHLILATQKPTGVVDDQIWSNSKFKLALKVQDESDSKEIIKTNDAAFITQPGRAYLQVGNNEIYELFQSAWSGASYLTEEQQSKIDDRIYKINVLGQSELINQDLSTDEKTKDENVTQLDAVVDYLNSVYRALKIVEVQKPWLPSLPEIVVHPDFKKRVVDTSTIKDIDLNLNIGLIDIPEEQRQENYSLDIIKEGNVAVFSSSGFGKSFTLGTLMLQLALKNSPQLVSYYVMDFGNSALIPYRRLPHVIDYMNFDSTEKIEKFQAIIEKEIKKRKQLFATELVQNFEMYNKTHDEKLGAIFIFLDNYDVVREISSDFEDFLMRMTRDGTGLGIYSIISATRSNAVRFSTLNNFKNKIVQYLFDEGEVLGLLGRSPYKLNDIKGRALVKHKFISMMQIYSPVEFEDDVSYINNLRSMVDKIHDNYTGDILKGIPVLPDVFTTLDYVNYEVEDSSDNLVGLCPETVKLISVKIEQSPFVIIGPSKSGKTNFIELMMNQIEGTKFVFDSESQELYQYQNDKKFIYVNNEEKLNKFAEMTLAEIQRRKEGFEKATVNNVGIMPKQYYETQPNYSIIIDDVDTFINQTKSITNILDIVNNASLVGINIIATVASSKLKGYDDLSKYFKNTTNGIVLGNQGALSIFPMNSTREIPPFGFGVIYDNGMSRRVMIPKYKGFKEE